MSLAPALVAVEHGELAGAPRVTASLAGLGACFGLTVLVSDRITTWGFDHLRRRLQLRLASEGKEVADGIFVSFAPDREPRLYESYSGWDLGYLFLEADRLIYLGGQARFEIPRDFILAVSLEPGMPSWSRSQRLVVGFRGASATAANYVSFWVAETRSIRASRERTANLKHRLETWLGNGSSLPRRSSLPRSLGLPSLDSVTSEPARAAVRAERVVQTLLFVLVGAILISILFDLDFSHWSGGGWYVLLVSPLTALFRMLPLWLHRKETA